MDKFEKALPEEEREQYRQEKKARNLRAAKNITLASMTVAAVTTVAKAFIGSAYYLTLMQIIAVSVAVAGLIQVLIPVAVAKLWSDKTE